MKKKLEEQLRIELTALRARDLYRKCRNLKPSSEGPFAEYEGGKLLLFCGNDYLGLSHHPRVVKAATVALEQYGTGAGASRLISGTSHLHVQLEEGIAKLKKKESAIVYSAGFLGNLGVLSSLANEEDVIIMDKLCHASLIDGARLSGAEIRVFPHKNYARCAEILEKSAASRRVFLVSDSVFSMDGDLADLGELVRLKEKYGATLLVDDAHGTGVFGPHGGGVADGTGLEEKIDIYTGTFSKAFGSLGGFAAASKTVIDYLVNTSRSFIFATALPPALCAASLEALKIIRDNKMLREKLWKNVRTLHKKLSTLKKYDLGAPVSPILPLIIGAEKEALRVSEFLLKEGLLIPAVRTPSVPKGKARLRITLSAEHTEEQISRLAALVSKA